MGDYIIDAGVRFAVIDHSSLFVRRQQGWHLDKNGKEDLITHYRARRGSTAPESANLNRRLSNSGFIFRVRLRREEKMDFRRLNG